MVEITIGLIHLICVSVQMHSLLVELRLSSCQVIVFIRNTPPPMVEVSVSFLKTLKLVGKMSPLFIDEFSYDSVPQIKSALCRLFGTSLLCLLLSS